MKKENLNHAEMLGVLVEELLKQPDPSWERLRLNSLTSVGYMFGLCDRLYNEHIKYVAVRSMGLGYHDSIEDLIKYSHDIGKVLKIHSVYGKYSIEEVEIKK